MKKCFTILLASVALMLALPSAAQYNVTFNELELGSGTFGPASNSEWNVSRCRLSGGVFSVGTSGSTAYALTDEALKTAWASVDTKSAAATQVFSAILTKELTGISTLLTSYVGATGGKMAVFMFAKTNGSASYTFLKSAVVDTSDEGVIRHDYSAPQNLSAVAIVVRPGTLTTVAKGRSVKLGEFKALPAVEQNAKPTFSLVESGITMVMAGTKVQITAPAEAENAQIHYTINGGAKVVASSPVQLTIGADSEIKAYVTTPKCDKGEEATASFTVFDVNADFKKADGKVINWTEGGFADNKVSSDGTGTVVLTQGTKSDRRFRTVRFWALPGEYSVSASATLGGANVTATSTLKLEYTQGATSNSYNKLDTITGATSGTLSGSFTLDESAVITLSFFMSKNPELGQEVTATISNLIFSRKAPTAVRGTEVALLRAWTDDGVLRVCAEPGSKVEVFDMSGRCVATAFVDAEVCSLSGLPVGQLLVVRCGGKTTKIVVR